MDDDSATDGFDRAVEHRQNAITRIVDELPLVLCDAWLNYFAPVPHHACVRSFLIELHEAAISRNISREDCRKPSHGPSRRWGAISATADRMNLTTRPVDVTHCVMYLQRRSAFWLKECVRLNAMTSVKSR